MHGRNIIVALAINPMAEKAEICSGRAKCFPTALQAHSMREHTGCAFAGLDYWVDVCSVRRWLGMLGVFSCRAAYDVWKNDIAEDDDQCDQCANDYHSPQHVGSD